MKEQHIHTQHKGQSNFVRDRRGSSRKTLKQAEDLIVDINNEVSLSDLNAELRQKVKLTAAHKNSDPSFWLHAFKFLNDFKDDIHTRLWTGNRADDHQARLSMARYSTVIQLRLLIRGKTIPAALQSALNYLFAPALTILMLRSGNDRESRTLINAMHLVYEVIDSYQDHQSPLKTSQSPAQTDLRQRIKDFFGGFSGIKDALTPEALTQLSSDENFACIVPELGRSQTSPSASTVEVFEKESDDKSAALLFSALTSPVAFEAKKEDPRSNIKVTQAISATDTRGIDGVVVAPTLAEAVKPKQATAPANAPSLEAPPLVKTPKPERTTALVKSPDLRLVLHPPLEEEDKPNEKNESHAKAGMSTIDNAALDTLLKKISKEHHLTWFKVQVSNDSRPRTLMLGNYQYESQLLEFVNVHQKPIMTLSAADFHAGLKAGLNRPIYDEPELVKLLDNYLASSSFD